MCTIWSCLNAVSYSCLLAFPLTLWVTGQNTDSSLKCLRGREAWKCTAGSAIGIYDTETCISFSSLRP